MCGCSKNKNLKQMMSGSMLKTAEQLIAEGVAQWYKYSGPVATRLGHATGTRYSVNPDKCALLATEDYEWFATNRPGMFTPCPVEMVSGKSTSKTTSKITVESKAVIEDEGEGEYDLTNLNLNESTDDLDAVAETESAIDDITTLTVNDALPIIREAATHTLDVWTKQEKGRDGGPRQMILTAISKRREEIKVEAKG